MEIDDKLIEYLEELSRLAMTGEEKEQVKNDLTNIISYMAKLAELDAKDLPALSHPFEAVNRFRNDMVTPSYERGQILANAPMRTEEYFKAPRTVE